MELCVNTVHLDVRLFWLWLIHSRDSYTVYLGEQSEMIIYSLTRKLLVICVLMIQGHYAGKLWFKGYFLII